LWTFSVTRTKKCFILLSVDRRPIWLLRSYFWQVHRKCTSSSPPPDWFSDGIWKTPSSES
jgi:hypothetical protein